ncbi:hypothetical protein [Parapedobacter soli]|uniref:hypothetical protein n=1 Tax=Parapedobacter soli TaxID=416955 RepID=UPI0021C6AD6D|nr:hypothetical protein [Parapedobacter soli]
MERIVLEVRENTAKKWQHVAPKAKQRIYEEVDRFLNVILEKQPDDLWPFLEKLRADADRKGFNDAILDEIVNDG